MAAPTRRTSINSCFNEVQRVLGEFRMLDAGGDVHTFQT